jgi:hypothetical protein
VTSRNKVQALQYEAADLRAPTSMCDALLQEEALGGSIQ